MDATISKSVIAISLGVNDSAYVQSEKANWVPKEEFAKNLKKLFKISRKYTNSIFFISLQPIDDSKTNPFTGDKDLFYTNKNIKEYDEIAKLICKQEKIEFIDIYDRLKDSKRLTAEDGLHLNSKGHELIFETVKDFLVKKKII
jgi:lysophospholipase L1-like esterase